MTAVLFGSISALADTSELQRRCFNDAFAAHDLDWHWDQDAYRDMLQQNGGQARIASYAAEQGVDVDTAAVHATKSRLFQERLRAGDVSARDGVRETLDAAREAGHAIGFITTTSSANVSALLESLGLEFAEFDLVTSADDIETGKPDGEVYRLALERLDQAPHHCVAIEDNVGGVESATAVGIPCLALPNDNTSGHDFDQAAAVLDDLTPEAVLAHLTTGATP